MLQLLPKGECIRPFTLDRCTNSTSSQNLLQPWGLINPCCAEFPSGSIKYICIFCHSAHCEGTGSWNTYMWKSRICWPITWLLMTWWHKELGHQQPWYWPSSLNSPGIFRFQHHWEGSLILPATSSWARKLPVSTVIVINREAKQQSLRTAMFTAMLTHLLLDKMAAILADDISKHIFSNENLRIMFEISRRFVPKGPIDNNQALV